jgi:hypothetical protein
MRDRRAPAYVANLDRARLMARCRRETQYVNGERATEGLHGVSRYYVSLALALTQNILPFDDGTRPHSQSLRIEHRHATAPWVKRRLTH